LFPSSAQAQRFLSLGTDLLSRGVDLEQSSDEVEVVLVGAVAIQEVRYEGAPPSA
jgi:hypothetical protein